MSKNIRGEKTISKEEYEMLKNACMREPEVKTCPGCNSKSLSRGSLDLWKIVCDDCGLTWDCHLTLEELKKAQKLKEGVYL